ncbi:2TM domain-containing protein [Winogradskyella rapida]|uniref:2TM domain-containing protein n=1 Tax=Winogradskyella rapida TaxID=549701 RepID=A0ABW3KQ48_9FLAO
MSPQDQDKLEKAKAQLRKVKIFYIHLIGYCIVIGLLLYNLYIVAGPYKNNITSLNLSVMVAWTVFIIVHGLTVFKNRSIFKKNWEDRKREQYLEQEKDKEEHNFWE